VRLPEGDVPAPAGAGVSKSVASRHFVALSAARMKEWMGADLSALDIMVVQIDGIHISEHLVLVAARLGTTVHRSHRCWRICTCAGSCWDGRCSGWSTASAHVS
jgi:hypothetical protein